MAGTIKGAHVSEEQFMRDMHERVMPAAFKIPSSYIIRAMLLPVHRPPYAVDIFVSMDRVDMVIDQDWSYEVELSLDDAEDQMNWTRRMDSEGFIIAPNAAPVIDPALPERIAKVGYFLGNVTLNDIDLELLERKPILSHL